MTSSFTYQQVSISCTDFHPILRPISRFLFITTTQTENKNTWMPCWPRTFIKPHHQFTVLFISLGTHLRETAEWVFSCLNLSSHSPHYIVQLLFCLAQWQEWMPRPWLHFKTWDPFKRLTNCHSKWQLIPTPLQVTSTDFNNFHTTELEEYILHTFGIFSSISIPNRY